MAERSSNPCTFTPHAGARGARQTLDDVPEGIARLIYSFIPTGRGRRYAYATMSKRTAAWRLLYERACWAPVDYSSFMMSPQVRNQLSELLVELDLSGFRDWEPVRSHMDLFVRNFPNLCKVVINGRGMDCRTLADLSKLAALTHLDLSDCSVRDEHLEWISALGHLTHLDVSGCVATGPGLRHLASLPKLARLVWTSEKPATNSDLEPLTRLTALTHLEIGVFGGLPPSTFAYLEQLPHLRHLTARGICPSLSARDFEPMSRMLALTNLELRNWHDAPLDSLRYLSSLQRLTHLVLQMNLEGRTGSLAHLSGLRNLAEIDLRGSSYVPDEAQWRAWLRHADLPSLQRLILPGIREDGGPQQIEMAEVRAQRDR